MLCNCWLIKWETKNWFTWWNTCLHPTWDKCSHLPPTMSPNCCVQSNILRPDSNQLVKKKAKIERKKDRRKKCEKKKKIKEEVGGGMSLITLHTSLHAVIDVFVAHGHDPRGVRVPGRGRQAHAERPLGEHVCLHIGLAFDAVVAGQDCRFRFS